jgi:hypothetical protein
VGVAALSTVKPIIAVLLDAAPPPPPPQALTNARASTESAIRIDNIDEFKEVSKIAC